jgi:hypothetical protein
MTSVLLLVLLFFAWNIDRNVAKAVNLLYRRLPDDHPSR